jgi:hypothetical protein
MPGQHPWQILAELESAVCELRQLGTAPGQPVIAPPRTEQEASQELVGERRGRSLTSP